MGEDVPQQKHFSKDTKKGKINTGFCQSGWIKPKEGEKDNLELCNMGLYHVERIPTEAGIYVAGM